MNMTDEMVWAVCPHVCDGEECRKCPAFEQHDDEAFISGCRLMAENAVRDLLKVINNPVVVSTTIEQPSPVAPGFEQATIKGDGTVLIEYDNRYTMPSESTLVFHRVAEACNHEGWSYEKDGRRCRKCLAIVSDPGD